MAIITRDHAVRNLKKYEGQDLRQLAEIHGITTFETGKQNKGWKGLVLERLAGLKPGNVKAPNGDTFELKSVAFHEVNGEFVPKETMAIGMINPEELRKTPFFKSHFWFKLRSLILCAVSWHGKNAQKAELLKVVSFDFLDSDDLIKELASDYEYIRNKLIQHGFESLTGKDGKWIQARTKGAGHGSTTRAFYARTDFLKRIMIANKIN